MKTIQEAIIAIDELVDKQAKICEGLDRELASMSMNDLFNRHNSLCVMDGLLKAQAAVNGNPWPL